MNKKHEERAERIPGFEEVFGRMIEPEKLERLCREHAPVARTAPKLSAAQVVSSLVYHQLQRTGTLAQSARSLHQIGMSDSAFSQRRQGLPQELFEQITAAALGPLAEPAAQPEAFYRGLRLVGLDGTQYSVSNTPALLQALPKAASRRLEAAFAKLQVVTLMELGVHNPLAVAVAPASCGEVTLARSLWARVADQSLVIVDRGFGTPSGLFAATQAWSGRRVEWLARIRKDIKTDVLERLPDGSALVEVPVCETDERGKRTQVGRLCLREIHYEVCGRNGRPTTVRLWTSLLDTQQYPALELAQNYARRWEHEVAYRELKLDVRSAKLLSSHTLETALQEVLAVVLAMAVVTRLRLAAGAALDVPVLRVSFLKILLLTQQLWHSFSWSLAELTPSLRSALCQRYFDEVRHRAILPSRRSRSCPRAVRQPVCSWPRKTSQPSSSRPFSLSILPLP